MLVCVFVYLSCMCACMYMCCVCLMIILVLAVVCLCLYVHLFVAYTCLCIASVSRFMCGMCCDFINLPAYTHWGLFTAGNADHTAGIMGHLILLKNTFLIGMWTCFRMTCSCVKGVPILLCSCQVDACASLTSTSCILSTHCYVSLILS